MRSKLILNSILLAGLVLTVTGWVLARRTGEALRGRLDAQLAAQRESQDLTAERDRLRAALLTATLARDTKAPAATAPSTVPVERITAPAFPPGEWTPAKMWRNEGRRTARSTIDTVLWAAAGGDLAAFAGALEFDDDTRAKLHAVFQDLPPAARHLYATPEDMLAGATVNAIPPTAAQISWFHQIDANHATVGLMVANPDPALPAKFTVLSLRQTNDGWRISVPRAAVLRLAKQLQPGRE